MDILADDAPAPRLCHLIKWPDFDGYGFNLHAERSNPGQFIGKIDDDSPAQMAGLREGDRIVEVNGVNISNENHRQVVERIKSDPEETKLLVVDSEADLWYKEQDIVLKSSQLNVVYIKTPTPRPQADSPRAKFHQASTPAANESGEIQTGPELQQQHLQQVSLSPSTTIGSSLETNDFNEDSIEQAAQQTSTKNAANIERDLASQVKGATTRCSPPPMSPDSGKGDEEPSGQHVVTIEAEINRQSHLLKRAHADERIRLASPEAEVNVSRESYAKGEAKSGQEREVSEEDNHEEDEEESNVEPDSLSQPANGSMSSSRPTTASSQVSSSSGVD